MEPYVYKYIYNLIFSAGIFLVSYRLLRERYRCGFMLTAACFLVFSFIPRILMLTLPVGFLDMFVALIVRDTYKVFLYDEDVMGSYNVEYIFYLIINATLLFFYLFRCRIWPELHFSAGGGGKI